MGKWLYTNLYTIFSQLGSYAFPNGKPQIDWGGGNPPVIPPCTVSKTIGTGLSSTGGDSDVAFGDPLEVAIAISNNLYIVDDDSVVVTMGGSPVQGAWNASTMKVTIAAVTGNVVINVPSLTYVQDGLAFQLDGLNRGGTAGHWVDRIGNIDFTLTDCDESNDDHVVFNGISSQGIAGANDVIDVDAISGTVEVGYKMDSALGNGGVFPIMRNSVSGKVACGLYNSNNSGSYKVYGVCLASNTPDAFGPIVSDTGSTSYIKGFLSMRTKTYVTGGSLTPEEGGYFNGSRTLTSNGSTSHGISTLRIMSSSNGYTKGSLYTLRVYRRKLTDAEILHNYAVDIKRFNIL